MRTIHRRIISDEARRPVAVQIDYPDWVEIARELHLDEAEERAVDVSRFAGVISLGEEPLEYQARLRGEWT